MKLFMFLEIAFTFCYERVGWGGEVGLTLKEPSKIAADNTYIFLPLSFEENKA